MVANLRGERDKYAVNLFVFFFDEAHQLVVLLDGFERLHIHRLPGRTGAVHHAGDAPLEFAAHGNDEAVAANGDEVVLRRAFRAELAERCAWALFDDAPLPVLLAANAAEFRRSIVSQRAIRLNLALDRLGEHTKICR